MRKIIGTFAAIVVLAALTVTIDLRAQERPPRCDEIEGFHVLDFWVGEWSVVDVDGNPQGENRIEKILEGCAIMEHWRGAGGSDGKSLFYYDHLGDAWKQVWVTPFATMPGGLKEKELVEVLADGGVRFQGTIHRPDGSSYLDRTTLTPLPDGRVRQLIESSTDGGAGWERRWEGIYVRRRP